MKDKKKASKRVGYKVPRKELTMFALGAMGQGMIYTMMTSYVSDFYVNVLQLPLTFVLMLMLFARLWDAINDPMMGMIIDHRTTKHGKMKPYIIYAVVPIALLTILMYTNPNLSNKPLMVFTAIVYVLWGMAYTMADVPFWGLPNVMTDNAEERGYVISFSKNFNGVGSAIPEVLFLVAGFVLPLFLDTSNAIDYNQKKYFIIAIVTVGIGIVLFANSYFHIKERVVIPDKKRMPGEPSQLSRIFKCKPLVLVILMGILSSGRYMTQAAAIHVARYAFYIGPELTPDMTTAERTALIDASVSSVKTIFQGCAIIGMFGAMLFMPYLMKKFDYKKIVITSCLLGFVSSIFTTIIGWKTANLYICTPFILISSIPLGVLNVISNAMICDCLDYIELNTGYRDNALGAACQGFINKFGSAMATCTIILMYLYIGLDPSKMLSSETILCATDLTRTQNFAMFSLVSIVPGISMLLCTIPMFFYKISGKEKERIITELQKKRAAEGITIQE